MWRLISLFYCFASISFSAIDLSKIETTEEHRVLLGLGIQFLVPNQLTGFESTQMVFCPRLYMPWGPGHLQIGASYGTDTGDYPRLSQIFIGELGYRMDYKIRFFTGFLTAGGQYSRYFSELGDFRSWGPHVGWGLIFPLARGFRMGAEMRALMLSKIVLGFGGNFTFSL